MGRAPRLRLLDNPGNRGKGYSVRNGMLNAQGDVLLFSDADLSSPISEAPKLFAAIDNGADVAIGSRWLNSELQTQRQSLVRQLFGRIYNLLLRVILGLDFKDTQCGFKAFTRPAARLIFSAQKIERWGFDPELLYLARQFGFRVDEVPVAWAHSEGTRISPLRDGSKMFLEMLKTPLERNKWKIPKAHHRVKRQASPFREPPRSIVRAWTSTPAQTCSKHRKTRYFVERRRGEQRRVGQRLADWASGLQARYHATVRLRPSSKSTWVCSRGSARLLKYLPASA